MIHRVTVYSLLQLEDEQSSWMYNVAVRVEFVGTALVPALPGDCRFDRIVAEGWEKVVGIARRSFLLELGAPAAVISGTTTAAGVLDEEGYAGSLIPAPSGLAIGDSPCQWLYDNCVESWLITVLPAG